MRTVKKQGLIQAGLLTLLAAVLLTGCDSGVPEQEQKAPVTASEPSVTPVARQTSNTIPTVRVLYRAPEFVLTSHTGEAFDSDDLYGRVWVANFIFTQCKDSCPLQTESMKQLQQTMQNSPNWDSLSLVSFSVDPDTDTPEVLSQYIADRGVKPSHWSFLTGTRETIWSLTKNGFKLPVADDSGSPGMPILHSQSFVLVDWEGRIRGYYDSLDEASVAELHRDMKIVVGERYLAPDADVLSPKWVKLRQLEQLAAAEKYDVFHDFSFTDQIRESGIQFLHKGVDDAARDYKAVHYDHGNGIAIADVDGDGKYDIYFSTQAGSDELWRNLGGGKFENITDSAGLRDTVGTGVGVSFADIDNDGDPDLYVTRVRTGNRLYENDGKGHFTDITEQSGLGYKAHSSGSVFFDYDRDGLLDLFLTNVGVYTTDAVSKVTLYTPEKGHHVSDYEYFVGYKDAFSGHLKPERYEKSVLFRNLGGNRFEDVSEKTGLMHSGWSGDATVIDGNNDGWPDLYVLSMEGHDQYYENVEGNSFVDRSREVFQKTSWGAMGVRAFDFDNDGDQDIFVTDMHSDMSESIGPRKEKLKIMTFPESYLQSGGNSIYGNSFYRNEGDGTYTEVSDEIGAENYWPWGLGTGDLNADGFEDAFLTSSMSYPFRYAINSLLLNDKGKGFLDSEYVLGVEPRRKGRTAMPVFDLDCAGADSANDFCKDRTRNRAVVWGALGSRSSVIFDLDQDGDLDIVTNEFNTYPMVLISDLSDRHDSVNFINVRLTGARSNSGGIGATIKVHAGSDVYTKVNDGKSGYLSQSLFPVYFGLGDNAQVDKVEISWPSGVQQVVTGPIKIGALLDIKEQ